MVRLCRDGATALYRASWLALLLAMLAAALEPTLSESPPTVSSASVNGTQLTIKFSESLTSSSSANAADFAVNLGGSAQTVSAASVSGGNVVLTLGSAVPDVECTSDSVTVDYTATNSTLTSSGGGTVAAFTNQSVTNNTDAAPQIASVATDTTGRYIYVTFCEPIDNLSSMWSNPDFDAFSVSVDGTARTVEELIRSSSNTSRLEIRLPQKPLIKEGQTVSIAYDKSKGNTYYPLRDLNQGDKLVESWSARSVTNIVDNPPSLVSVTALWDVITLTYSETLNEDSVPTTSAFQISDKPFTVKIESVAVSGKTVKLATDFVIRGGLSPKFQLRYSAPSTSPLQQSDGAKNAPNFHSQEVTSSTPTTKPVFQSAAVNGATLTITFDLPLKNVARASAFAVGGVTGINVSSTSYSGKVVTLTLSSAVSASDTVTVSYTKNGPPRIEARNIKDADSFSAKAVTNNTPDPAPTFSSASINAAGDTLAITMNKNLLTTTAGTPGTSAFTLSGGSAKIAGIAVSGKQVTLTLSPKADEGETITIAYTKPSGANEGKLQSATGSHIVASWAAQSVTNNADGKPRPTSATVNGATLAITFDRTLNTSSTPAGSRFTINGTTATVSLVAIAGSTATLTLSAAVAHTDVITVDYTKPSSGGIKRSGKDIYANTFSMLSVTNNTPDPKPTFSSASVNAAGDTLTITMTKDLLTTAAGTPVTSAFMLSGGSAAITGIAVSGKKVTLTLSPTADEGDSITIAYTKPTGAGGKLQSQTGGHLVASWTAQTVTNNADGKPRPTSAMVNGATLTITFDRALDTSSTPDITKFTVNGTTATASSVAISGSTATLTLSAAVAHTDMITVDYTKPSSGGIKRFGKDIYADTFSMLSVTNNTPDPTPTFASASINAAGDKLTITMTKNLLTTTAGIPSTSAFTLSDGSAAITGIALSGKTVNLTLSPKADEGEVITIAYTKPTGADDGKFQSATGSHIVASWTAQTVTNNADGKPRPTSATVNGTTLAISFDRALDTSSVPAASTFTINGTSATASSVAISGSIATLTLSAAVAHDDTITASYAKPGNGGVKRFGKAIYADSFTALSVTNSTPDPTPTFASASINTAGDTLAITMSKYLLTTTAGTPVESAFTLSGGSAAITGIAVSGKTVSLTLSPKADHGETITIAYTKPNGDNDGKLQSATGGHMVASWTAQSVTNNADGKPRPTSATVNGATLKITFDRTLDTSPVPAASTFTLEGTSSTASSVAIADSTVTLTLNAAVAHDATISVAYAKPGSNPLKRANRSIFADSFSAFAVTNNTPDPTPMFSSASINAAGDALTITMTKDLLTSAAGIPDKRAFTIAGGSAAITAVAVNGKTVSLTLSPKADEGETVTIAYMKAPASIPNKLQSATGGHIVASWSAQSVTNSADGKPRPMSAIVNGATLVITFDRSLDETKTPPVAAFTITATPTSATVSRVAVQGLTVTLTLASRLSHSDLATVSYDAHTTPKLTRAGRALTAASFSDITVRNDTPAPPTIASAVGNGQTITLTFSAALDDQLVPGASAFSLGADQPTVSTVAISGETLTLTLAAALSESGAYSLTYTVPQTKPLLSSQSVPVPAFTQTITNDTDTAPAATSATGDGATVTIAFDQGLDSESEVPKTALSITSNSGGSAVTVASVSHRDQSLSLTLSRALVEDETGSVTYTKPPQDGIADAKGNRTASFTLTIDNRTDTEPVPVSGTVNESTITITLDQDIYDDPRFHDEDGYPTGHFTLSGAISQMTFIQVSNDAPGGHGLIVITLDEPVGEGDNLSINYYPTFGSIRIREDDAGKRRAQINTYALTNLTDYPPRVVSASVDEATLTVTFDQDLDPASKPPSTAYSLSNDGPSITESSISSDTLTLMLAKTAIEDASYTLSYTPPETGGLRDITGNATVAFSEDVTNNTDYAPTPVELTTDTHGTYVDLRFDQSLDSSGSLDSKWFSFDPDISISSVQRPPNEPSSLLRIQLQQDTPIREGASVTLTYTPGELQDDAGNEVAAFTKKVDNIVDVAPIVATGENGEEQVTVTARTLTIEFDQELSAHPAHIPPAKCEDLPNDELDCAIFEEQPWFTVKDMTGMVPLESISVEGSTVVITLSKRIGPLDDVMVEYQSISLEDKEEDEEESEASVDDSRPNYNLRDTSDPANHVVAFNPITAINKTAATPVSAGIDRNTFTNIIKITFDGDLRSDEQVDTSVMEVTIDGKRIDFARASSEGATLTATLSGDVPECATVRFSYHASDGNWRDDRGYAIQTIRNYPVANFIDPDWGLECITSDSGGVALRFGDGRVPSTGGWRLMVDDEERQLLEANPSPDGNLITLTPTPPVCLGERVAITHTQSGQSQSYSRVISPAAPCAVSAVADRTTMTVTFDQPLDQSSGSTPPTPADFTLTGSATIEAVERIEGRVLTLKLSAPGLHKSEQARLSYIGTTLQGAGLTVGVFELEVLIDPAAPKLESAIGFRSWISLQFDQQLFPRSISGSRFVPHIHGYNELNVRAVDVSGASVLLELSRDLPDDEKQFAVVYLARQSGGLESVLGARVADSVFIVENLTETPPTVESAVANGHTITITFDQRITATDAQPSDFTAIAGRRTITPASLELSPDSVVIELTERITSLDAVQLIYAPATPGSIRDLSGLKLEPFEVRVENGTPLPRTVQQKVDDAALRSSNGETTFARELARGFASDDGIRATAAPGEGWTRFARRDLMVSVDAASIGDSATRIYVQPLAQLTGMMMHLQTVPSSCWNSATAPGASAWWIGQTDLHGIPTDRDVRVTLSGTDFDISPGFYCVLDLRSDEWRLPRWPETFVGPALVLKRGPAPNFRTLQRLVWSLPPR